MADRWPREDYARDVWASDLDPSTKLVALAYAHVAGSRDVAYLSLPDLAAMTGLSRATAQRHRNALAADGWLEVAQAGTQHLPTTYRLTVPSVLTTSTLPPSQDAHHEHADESQGAHHESQGDQNSAPGCSPRAPKKKELLKGDARATTRPPRTCPAHPHGTTEPCRPCGDARKAHDAWSALPPPAAADVLTGDRCSHGDLVRLVAGLPACPLCRNDLRASA